MVATEVLPLVPVIPISFNVLLGVLYHCDELIAKARREVTQEQPKYWSTVVETAQMVYITRCERAMLDRSKGFQPQ